MMGGGLGMGLGWLFGLLVLAGVAVLVVVAVRAVGGGVKSGRGSDSEVPGSRARQILEERYARGEITTEEYRERLRALGDGS